jgi:hypothetical protein
MKKWRIWLHNWILQRLIQLVTRVFIKARFRCANIFFLMKKGIVGEGNEYEKVSLWLQKLNIIVKINLRVMI